MRVCIKCKEEKPATEEFFYKDKKRALGLMYRCKACDKLRKDGRVGRYKNMSDEAKAKHYNLAVLYRQTKKGKAIGLLAAYKKNDSCKGLECTVSYQMLYDAVDSPCTYCGYPSTGFDRIDNSIGHTIDNCVAACKECNVARMDNFTHKETFILGQTIKAITDAR